MTFNDILKESWLSISGNKIRSFLTILGIIIGVMAVVIMMSVGDAVQNQITGQFSSLGTNTIMIRAGAARTSGVRTMSAMNTLTTDDVTALMELPDVNYATPIRTTSGTLVFGNKNWTTSAIGSYPTYTDIQNIEMERGTFFDWTAVRNASTAVVIGPTVARELDMGSDPVGQVVRMNGVPLVVLGVTTEKGGAGMTNSDDMVFIPITTLQKRVMGSRFPNSVPQIVLKLNDGADNAIATEQITGLLRERHRLKDTDADDFQITDMKQIMDTMDTITGFLKTLLMAIASVSLLVGSIGIMNMMLVSVAERTREIGIRKAIGARESHITIQFLSEAILISFIGSMIGLALGVILSQTILPSVMDMDVPLNIWSVFLSIGVAGFVGIASGVMPARKAAKLNPIDALRYE
ncbi:MAG: ABC transporter permease [Rickettsiales bacterium]|jgi:putative ABC transport system permease protein|nr:ABC transporter permease [Rickettsiales bacterium]